MRQTGKLSYKTSTTLLKGRASTYMQHIYHPHYQMLKLEQNARTCTKGKFKMFLFFQDEHKKTLRLMCEDWFIEKKASPRRLL